MIARRCRFLGSAALVLLGIVIGGGRAPLADMLIELAGVALFAALWIYPSDRPGVPGSRWALGLLLLLLALLLVQLVPLPPGIWMHLPGRDEAAAITRLAGQSGMWRPLSLDPEGTRASALALLPAAALFTAVTQASIADRRMLGFIVIAGAVGSALLGVLQVADGSTRFYPFVTNHYGYPVGLFANRNHQGDLMLVAAVLLAGAAMRSEVRSAYRLLGAGLLLLLAGATVTTGSRTAIVLLLPVAAATLLASRAIRARRRAVLASAAVLIVTLAAGWFLLGDNPVIGRIVRRFGLFGGEFRVAFWRDTVFAIRQYWPLGSGFGTFVPVYASVEDMAAMSFNYVNHAHQEYLELALEGGLPAVFLVLAYFVLAIRQVIAARAGDARIDVRLAAIAIAALLLHSLVDYPLRTQSLMLVFAYLNASLFIPAERKRNGPRMSRNKTAAERLAAS